MGRPWGSWLTEARERSASLERLSAPWRTELQLGLLARAPRGREEACQFAVVGDAEPGRFWFSRALFNVPGVFELQLRAIQEHPVDFSIQLGDMVSRGVARNYLRFFRQLARLELRRPYLSVIGNHDRRSPHRRSSASLYRSCFGRTNYFFDHGPARFVVLDTSQRGLRRSQLRWLDLALRTELRKIVFTHIPPRPLRAWTDFGGARGLGGFGRGARAFMETVSRRGVERVYLGHIHGFGVQDCGGVRYVLSGGGGSPLFPSRVRDRFHHYLVVSVDAAGVRERVHGLDGCSFDIPSGKVLLEF